MDEEEQQGVVLFGRDLSKIPCFRQTFIYSISSYIGVGLLTFLMTSKPAYSSHVGFASFIAVTLGYFTNCRMKYERKKREIAELLKAEEEVTTLTTKSIIKDNKILLADA